MSETEDTNPVQVSDAAQSETRDRGPAVWGALAGAALGLVDYACLRAFGVSVLWRGHEVLWAVMLIFGGTFAGLGWSIGRLWSARAELARQRDVIADQLSELERTHAELADAERLAAIGSMAAGVAHEVRNPLGVIRSSASLVLEDADALDEDTARAAQFIREEVDRLDSFVGELLDFARPIRPRSTPIAFAEMVADARRLVGPLLDPVDVRVSPRDAAEMHLSGDPDLLPSVVAGALLNAAQAMEEADLEHRVIVVAAQIDGADVVIDIVDSGPGLSDEAQQQAFEPFFTTRAKGTGLGLAMARRIVEAHGGTLDFVAPEISNAASPALETQSGACLRLRLPRMGLRHGRRQDSSDDQLVRRSAAGRVEV